MKHVFFLVGLGFLSDIGEEHIPMNLCLGMKKYIENSKTIQANKELYTVLEKWWNLMGITLHQNTIIQVTIKSMNIGSFCM